MKNRFFRMWMAPVVLSLILFSGCGLDTEFGAGDGGQLAAGELNAQFLDGPMGTPITNTSIHVLARNSNQTEVVSQGQPVTTDENGSFRAFIERPERATIVEFVFEFEHDGESYSESVEEVLEIGFGDNIDVVNIRVHINQDEEEE